MRSAELLRRALDRAGRRAACTLRRVPVAALLLVFWLCGTALPAWAHKASDAYLLLQRTGDGVALRWDIALRDLDAVLDLDANADGKLSWGEVRARLDDIRVYALGHLQLQQGRCALAETQPAAVDGRVDGTYLVLRLRAACDPGAALEVDYRLFREVDPTHRGLLRVDSGGGAAPSLHPLDPAAGPVTIALPTAPSSASSSAAASTPGSAPAAAAPDALASPAAGAAPVATSSFLRDGVHHILIGYDHILFLVCLLLPAVLRRGPAGWQPVGRWRDAVWPMVGTVTMFTLGHSITLALAGLRLVTISPRVVEPAIALTIILAATDNLHPVLGGHRRVFTFLFGLIHGFGFAAVLQELDLPPASFAVALLQFNLGVEGGQLIVVTLALAVLLALRGWRGYPAVVLRGGSVAAAAVAAIWFVERVFDLKLLGF